MPDGRLFVAQQGGTLRVLQSNGALDRHDAHSGGDAQGERGLLGVTLHPNFASNSFIYVYYTTPRSAAHNRISRFTASGNILGQRTVLIDLPALSGATNHNGGALHFGNDGKLYVAVGDNADGDKAPDLNDPFGKMLRFNDDGSIPATTRSARTQGNLAARSGRRACAIRSPSPCARHRPHAHQRRRPEQPGKRSTSAHRGANYGWPSTEGPTSNSDVIAPLFAYDHDSGGPPAPPAVLQWLRDHRWRVLSRQRPVPAAYRGSYFFTDFCTR